MDFLSGEGKAGIMATTELQGLAQQLEKNISSVVLGTSDAIRGCLVGLLA